MIFYYTDCKTQYPEFSINGNELFVDTPLTEKLKLVYVPKINSITNLCDSDEVDFPDSVARIIPYYVKYDLYQEEEPSLATESLNQFEKMVNALKRDVEQNCSCFINSVYRSE